MRSPRIREHGLAVNPVDGKEKDDLSKVNLDILAKYGYDIKNKLGTITYESQKFSFNRWSNIHAIYKASFKQEADDLFKRHDQIKILEAVRNVLTHRAGVIDEPFQSRVKNDSRLTERVQHIDTKLILNAGDVTHYVNSVIMFANELLVHVSSWLVQHPN